MIVLGMILGASIVAVGLAIAFAVGTWLWGERRLESRGPVIYAVKDAPLDITPALERDDARWN